MAISQGFSEGTVRYSRSSLQVLVEVGDDVHFVVPKFLMNQWLVFKGRDGLQYESSDY